jgi:hypothetical protein
MAIFEPGDQIMYIPGYANGNPNDPGAELGFVQAPGRWYPEAVFCRFYRKGHPGELRTVANSVLALTSCLQHYISVPQETVNRLREEIDAKNEREDPCRS